MYIHPATPPSFRVNENNRFLWQGAVKSGYTPEKIPRNVKGCVDCGHCCFGCRHGSKQSTITALLEPLLLRQYRDPSVKGKCINLHTPTHTHTQIHLHTHSIV
ncbi:hypothetical protein EON63_02170 [archaeon]|nr:MAG: hypothetical protein EON63_02170 [archaeon]